jgi:hypothetical protein
MPHDGILRATAARAGATADPPMTLGKRLEAGETQRSVAHVRRSTISRLAARPMSEVTRASSVRLERSDKRLLRGGILHWK